MRFPFREPIASLLLPVSAVYDAVTRMRNLAYDHHLLRVYNSSFPVVSVGNVTIGGNGKTPFVRFLAQQLLERGYHPAILSRGYGATHKGYPRIVMRSDRVQEVGDEAFMQRHALSDDVQILLAHDRAAGVRFLEEKKEERICILDDGFQHRRLRRDLDLILVDPGEEGLSKALSGRILPSGPFRESPQRALKRASAIIVSTQAVGARDLERSLPLPVFSFVIQPTGVLSLDGREQAGTTALAGAEASLFSSIARPERFQRTVEALGVKVRRSLFIRDHAFPDLQTLERLESQTEQILVTEKDAVKLRELLPKERQQKYRMLTIAGQFSTADETERFSALLEAAIRQPRATGHASVEQFPNQQAK